jgi:hypothetical protein
MLALVRILLAVALATLLALAGVCADSADSDEHKTIAHVLHTCCLDAARPEIATTTSRPSHTTDRTIQHISPVALLPAATGLTPLIRLARSFLPGRQSPLNSADKAIMGARAPPACSDLVLVFATMGRAL